MWYLRIATFLAVRKKSARHQPKIRKVLGTFFLHGFKESYRWLAVLVKEEFDLDPFSSNLLFSVTNNGTN
ncbi:hypothetical protein [Neobacillus drentensis]|uniref:hypothetical protein n=1 Tax=Neobacillus drentensis TaxID=220684 RepID=UPI001470D2F5|nr:hypothetical protein [Neobacillus drentensis]